MLDKVATASSPHSAYNLPENIFLPQNKKATSLGFILWWTALGNREGTEVPGRGRERAGPPSHHPDDPQDGTWHHLGFACKSF